MPGSAPVVVDSAGCGATMKEYGRLLDSREAHAFNARVMDFSEWLALQPLLELRPMATEVVVQDPCHLRHAQKSHLAVRTVLAPAYTLVETADEGLCCGAGGAYTLTQPVLSRRILDRKVDALRAVARNADPIVASANPGCMVQLRAAGIDARHPADLIAERLAAIEEELRDLAYERLRQAARSPEGEAGIQAAAEERRLLQARRAIAKAIRALAPSTGVEEA